jgi:hypothetical protein
MAENELRAVTNYIFSTSNKHTMKFAITFILFSFGYWCVGYAQNQTAQPGIDPALAKKITVSGFCLCKTTVEELKTLDSNLQEINVEEMDLCNDGFVQDRRFINGKGYYSKKFPGIIFQKDNDNDLISKIRLTKDFAGNLPDGTPVNMKTLLAKDVINIYPAYDKTWGSRDCSNYWNLSNDTLSFFVRIDSTKKPRYPLDEAYYLEKPIEGIDLAISCYSLFNKTDHFSLFADDEPVFFLDSIRVNIGVVKEYQPSEIAFISVYKNADSLKITEPNAKNGIVYITTKTFAREHYWNYFKSRSPDYEKLVPDLKAEEKVAYILNDKVLRSGIEADLFAINDSNFIQLTVINKDQLKEDFKVRGKLLGVIIKTKK